MSAGYKQTGNSGGSEDRSRLNGVCRIAIPWEADAKTGRYLAVGAQAIQVFGFPLQEWYTDGFRSRHLHPDDHGAIWLLDVLPAAGGEVTYRMLTADGRIVSVRDVVMLVGGGGDPERLIGCMFDVTQQNQNDDLQGGGKRSGFPHSEHARDIVFTLSREGIVSFLNPAFERATGFKISEWIGKPFCELVHPDDRVNAEERFQQALLGEAPPLMEVRLWTKNGGLIVTEAVLSRRDPSGDSDILLGIARDVTGRKKADVDRHEREERFRTLAEGCNAVPFEVDVKTRRFTYLGPQMMRLLGYQDETWDPDTFFQHHLHPDDREFVFSNCAENESRLADRQFDFRMIAADGRSVWIHAFARTSVEPGRRGLCRGFFVDASDQKRREVELKRSQEQLRALAARVVSACEEERIRLAREIHDELGQALTGLGMDVNCLKLALSKTTPGEPFELLTQRADAIAAKVFETIRSLRHIATDLRPPILDKLGLSSAIAWQCRQFAERFCIKCELDLPADDPDWPGPLVTALFRILQEILTNVARHSNATQASISLRARPDGERKLIILTVSDNGRGISDKETEKPGSLGLLGIRERLLAFDGHLEVAGKLDWGTTITVRIPLAPPPKDPCNVLATYGGEAGSQRDGAP